MSQSRISKSLWGNMDDKEIFCFKIENHKGAFIELTNYGATLVSVFVPDKEGALENVVLGFSSLQGYLNDHNYLGATIGRFANRIANGTFSLDGKTIEIERNDGINSNHSGYSGFNKRVFDYQIKGDTLIFSLMSVDGEGGFPGNLKVEVHYQWNVKDELKITYFGQSDQNTLFNPTNHSYFDLSSGKSTILDHNLSIFSNHVIDADVDYIPTGDILEINEEQEFSDTRIGERLLQPDGDIKGINRCYMLDSQRYKSTLPAAELFDPFSGRQLSLYTSYPGLVLYTGSYLSTTIPGHHGNLYKPFDGLCLEAQFFPDSPNHLAFPSATINSGEMVSHYIVLEFKKNN